MSDQPQIGTVWIAPNGDSYRLKAYRTNWQSTPFDPAETMPEYAVMMQSRGFTSASELPAGAVVVWEPEVTERTDRGTGA